MSGLDVQWREFAQTLRKMRGYRLLDDDDVIRDDDETARASLLKEGHEDWSRVGKRDEFWRGRTVRWAQSEESGEMDYGERLFRRRVR